MTYNNSLSKPVHWATTGVFEELVSFSVEKTDTSKEEKQKTNQLIYFTRRVNKFNSTKQAKEQ